MPRVILFGITFDSQIESMRYLQLRDMQERGEIADLQTHPVFKLAMSPMTKRQRRYTADFQYRRTADGALVVEEVKPQRRKARSWTRDFPLRMDIARGLYPDRDFVVVTL